MRWPSFAFLACLAACAGKGCPADPGGFCTVGDSDCRGDYYCAVGGVCTKICAAESDCAPSCLTNEDCGSGKDDPSPDWVCASNVCECRSGTCPEAVSCIQGHCQRACAATNSCGYDPYAPRM